MTNHSVPGAEQFVPDGAGLERLALAVQGCRGCELIGLAWARRRQGHTQTEAAVRPGTSCLRFPWLWSRGEVTWRDGRH